MTKRFIVETSDDATAEKLNGLLYLGNNHSDHPDAPQYMLNIVEVTEIRETNQCADGTKRMTTKQRDALWEICGRYNVPFRERDYQIYSGSFSGLEGVAEGWLGGPERNGHNNMGKTIYVGVTPDGRINT